MVRSSFIALLAGVLLISADALGQSTQPSTPQKADMLIYIGTYNSPKSQGIYTARLDSATGILSTPQLAADAKNASFLALHLTQRRVYSTSEIGNFNGQKTGGVAGFTADESGKLTPINQAESGGGGPCFVNVDPGGRFVLVANYGAGTVSLLPTDAAGKLGEPHTIKHVGSGPNKSRQEGPHAHSITLDPAGQFAIAADLGIDKLLVYRVDRGQLMADPSRDATVSGGAGPRHIAFSPDGKFVYVVNEMASTVTALTYADGRFAEVQTLSALPPDYTGPHSAAHIVVHPGGKFLYSSNRRHDSIAQFAIDQPSGKLSLVGHTPSGGKTPRNFAVSPDGRFLIAANQDSNNLVVFRIDEATGKLTPAGTAIELGKPACVQFAPW